MVNRRFRAIRADESLDQTREGIITITDGCTFDNLCDAIVNNDWDQEFQGNRSMLKIVMADKLRRGRKYDNVASYEMNETYFEPYRLSGVTRLEIAPIRADKDLYDRKDMYLLLSSLAMMLPNLEEVDLSGATLPCDRKSVCGKFAESCSRLARLTWNGGSEWFGLYFSLSHDSNVRELTLDGSLFDCTDETLAESIVDPYSQDFLMMRCHNLERLSIKNAKLSVRKYLYYANTYSINCAVAIPQDALVKMIRRHPTLRWLRSDLSAENIAMLKQERPEIVFVSD